MAETILDLTTRVQLEPLKAGMADAVSAITSSVASMTADFAKLAAGTSDSFSALQGDIAELKAGFAELSATVTAAMAQVGRSVVEGSAEAGLGLNELKAHFADVGREGEITATGIGNLYGGFGALLGLGAVGVFLGSIVDGLDKFAVRIHKFSEETGIATDRAQEFETAMELMHIAPQEAELALLRLNRSLTLAAEGSKTESELFQHLGVNVTAWKNGQIDLIGVLEQIQAKTAEGISINERAGVSMQTMGRNARDMALILGITSQQFEALLGLVKQYGGVVSPQAIESFTRMSQEVTLLWTVVKAQLAEAFIALLPIIKFVIVGLSELALYVRVVWEAFVQLVSVVFNAGGVIAGAVLIMAGDWKTGTELMKASVQSFEDNFKRSMDNIIASNARASGTANILFSNSVDKMLDDLSRLKGGGTEDILAGITSGGSRVTEFKEQLEQMRSQADAFRGLSLTAERDFWQHILDTQKLNAQERMEVERELRTTLHKIALDSYQEQIALDQEFTRTSSAGSEERKFALQQAAAFTAEAYGQGSKQAIDANMKVLENQVDTDKIAAQDVQKSVEQQTESYKAGSAERIRLLAASIAQLRTMQDNILGGKTAAGGPETPAPVGPTPEADAALRVQIRRTEVDDIEKLVADLQAKVAEQYRAETSEVARQAAEQERLRGEAAVKAEDLAISAVQKSADEQIKEVDRLAQYDLITFKQKEEITRGIIQLEAQKEDAAINSAEASIRADEREALATIEDQRKKEAAVIGEAAAEMQAQDAIEKAHQEADQKIQQLDQQRLKLSQQIAQQEEQLADQVANHQVQQSQRAAEVMSSAFTKAFGTMLTQHTNFNNVMVKFWNDMVLGFEQMGLKIVANWIQSIAMRVLAEITGQTQITAAATAGSSQRTAIGALEDIKSIGRAAATAAAHAFKWVMEEVPFPANIALAPAVAAAAFAGVMAFSTLASAEKGMDVGSHPTLALLHPQEMVLPAALANTVRATNALGSAASSAALSENAAKMLGGSGGNVTHNHDNRHYDMPITVNQTNNKMTPAEITEAVRLGVRYGH